MAAITELLHTYDSWSDFVNHAKDHGDKKGSSHASYDGSMAKWAGASWEGALKHALEGWPEGYEAVRKASEALYHRVTNKIPMPETVFREVPIACVVDMGRFNDGEPECYIETVQTDYYTDQFGTKTVHLVVNCSASCSVSNKVIFTRGAAAVALAEALELVGRAVKLTLISTVTSSSYGGGNLKRQAEVRVLVKDYDGRANYDLLAFALCHGATLRRLVFAEEESFPQDIRREFGFAGCGGYGIPADTKGDKGDIYLPMAHGSEPQWNTDDKAVDWILDQLVKQGVHIQAED